MGAANCSQRCVQPTKELVIGCDSCGTAPQSSTIPTGHPPPEETGFDGGISSAGMVEENEAEEVPGECGWPDSVMLAPEVTGAEDMPCKQVLCQKRLTFRCDTDVKEFRPTMLGPSPTLSTVIEEADKMERRPSITFEVDDLAPADRNPLRKPTPFARMSQRPDEDDEAGAEVPEMEHQEQKPRPPPQKPAQPKMQQVPEAQASPAQPEKWSGISFFKRRAAGRKVAGCSKQVPPPLEDATDPEQRWGTV